MSPLYGESEVTLSPRWQELWLQPSLENRVSHIYELHLNKFIILEKALQGAGKRARQLNTLATLPESLDLIPTPTWKLTIHCNSSSGGLTSSSGLYGHCTQWCTYICPYT